MTCLTDRGYGPSCIFCNSMESQYKYRKWYKYQFGLRIHQGDMHPHSKYISMYGNFNYCRNMVTDNDVVNVGLMFNVTVDLENKFNDRVGFESSEVRMTWGLFY